MGKQFFKDWELWQQMVFVLACGIVVTIGVGLVKLQYDKYRIRKYTKVEKGKKAQTPEMLESQPVARAETREDVPFGIRAIESGIEVDGVWISRSNTPVGSSASSINDFKLPRSQNNSQLELPAALLTSSRPSSLATSSFDRAVSAERLPTNDSRSSSPGHQNTYDARGRPTVASTRYSNSNIIRNSTTLSALEGQDSGFSARYETQGAQAGSSNSPKSSSRRTSDESDYMTLQDGRPYEAAYINPSRHNPLAVPVDPRTDLDLLHNHRLSHVAETGQLTPRSRRPGNSGEWASVADTLRLPQEIATASNGVDYFVPQKTPSPPLAATAGPSQAAPAPFASASNQDDNASNEARQAVPLLETYAPKAQLVPESYQPSRPGHQFSYETLPYEVQTEQNQRDDHVVRKVNSGFEILRPGTFALPSPEEVKPDGEKRQSKRLQKKRRSSAGSRASNFVEQV